jgi:hypothetical protein
MPDVHSTQHLQFVWQLYHCRHSLLMFAEVFGLVLPLKRCPMLELLGWALHFLIDIPTHQGIFATISPGRLILGFDGIGWENGLFLAVNYSVRTLDFTCLWMLARR